MFRKLRTRKKNQADSEVALQITSMADVFTLLLVFLLKSYAESAVQPTPITTLKLPKATTQDDIVHAPRIEIAENKIFIEGGTVIPITGEKTIRDDKRVLEIQTALAKVREKQNQIANSNSDVKYSANILIFADESTPYSLIQDVLTAAAQLDFTSYRLAIQPGSPRS